VYVLCVREEVLKALDEAHAHLPNNTPPAQAAAALSDPDASTEEGAPQLEVGGDGLVHRLEPLGATRD
jgi:hypothetical protein